MCKEQGCGCDKPKKIEHTHSHEECSEEKKKECHTEDKEKSCPKHKA